MNTTSFFAITFLCAACTPESPKQEPFAPNEGTWIADSFEVVENSCNFETSDQTGVTMVLALSDDGFTISFEGDAPYTCTLSEKDFECEEPDSLMDDSDPDTEFSMDLSTWGSFISETEIELSSLLTINCLVDDCADYEDYFGTTFPCSSQTEIGGYFSE